MRPTGEKRIREDALVRPLPQLLRGSTGGEATRHRRLESRAHVRHLLVGVLDLVDGSELLPNKVSFKHGKFHLVGSNGVGWVEGCHCETKAVNNA